MISSYQFTLVWFEIEIKLQLAWIKVLALIIQIKLSSNSYSLLVIAAREWVNPFNLKYLNEIFKCYPTFLRLNICLSESESLSCIHVSCYLFRDERVKRNKRHLRGLLRDDMKTSYVIILLSQKLCNEMKHICISSIFFLLLRKWLDTNSNTQLAVSGLVGFDRILL